ncbi:MAG: hypothetical protein WAU01_02535 [Saprospiraceae bacterium]
MSKNSFKELEALHIKERGDHSEQIKSNIGDNISLFGFISNLIEVYIPRVGHVIQAMVPTYDKKLKDPK